MYGQPQQYGRPPQQYGRPPQQQQYGGRPPQQYGAPQVQGHVTGWAKKYLDMLSPHELQEVRAWFAAIDTDRSGVVTANEIQKCTFANVPLGFDTAAKLIRVFDKDHSGSIDFWEYACMHKFLSLMQMSFFAADTDRSGRLDAREIHHALQVGRMTVGLPAVQALFFKYNRDGYGVSFPDFLQLVSHIASAKSAFSWEHNAQGRKGSITLNFDKFLELTGRV